MQNQIKEYYQNLAPKYDNNRFENSYGKYIDQQERTVLNELLKKVESITCLDMGCGTGRLLNYADFGIDISEMMIEKARSKFPKKHLRIGNALSTPFPSESFENIISFHMLMHLDLRDTKLFFEEALRLLKPGGRLIFDFPSKHRRKLTGHQQNGWHAANDFRIGEIIDITCRHWILKRHYGVLFFPIHRLPEKMRPYFLKIDNLLCRSFFRKNASYLIFELEKK